MEKNNSVLQFSDYLTITQAARMLGVSSETLRNWDRLGKLKALRHPFNGYRLYLRSDLKNILEELISSNRLNSNTKKQI